jgi:hypothetical protein
MSGREGRSLPLPTPITTLVAQLVTFCGQGQSAQITLVPALE